MYFLIGIFRRLSAEIKCLRRDGQIFPDRLTQNLHLASDKTDRGAAQLKFPPPFAISFFQLGSHNEHYASPLHHTDLKTDDTLTYPEIKKIHNPTATKTATAGRLNAVKWRQMDPTALPDLLILRALHHLQSAINHVNNVRN